MKAFEENKHLIPHCTDVGTHCPISNGCEECDRAAGWRAALEHVLSNCILPNGMISETLIKRELESG